jgi:hypothetical protein
MKSFYTAIGVENSDVLDVEVEYSFSEVIQETMYSRNGDPGSPAEGGELEDMYVYDMGGNNITKTISPVNYGLLWSECRDHYERYAA